MPTAYPAEVVQFLPRHLGPGVVEREHVPKGRWTALGETRQTPPDRGVSDFWVFGG